MLYVGRVLFVNAVMLLARPSRPRRVSSDRRDNGRPGRDPQRFRDFIFGVDLYVGIKNPGKFDTNGLGWYCLWVTIIVIWLMWSFLWVRSPSIRKFSVHRMGHQGRSPTPVSCPHTCCWPECSP
ncbi:MAG: hypothetical protein AVDCRST_MAG14-1058 [uncultured Rubrobacteraceae bacterium]|uniref:Uncharacterized protein n=1 Tax=uncultured Rubrobacteraceae bacterium TaxID=349277 RepID=A0A6J4R0K8_9ACTN|nr:MAG: hypothetical protein AVDCRST_MAG14-1058 [uncultured Rubrobacteraceae bacterium]